MLVTLEIWLVELVEKRVSIISAKSFLRLHCAFAAPSVSCSSHSSRRRRKPEIVQRPRFSFCVKNRTCSPARFARQGKGTLRGSPRSSEPQTLRYLTSPLAETRTGDCSIASRTLYQLSHSAHLIAEQIVTYGRVDAADTRPQPLLLLRSQSSPLCGCAGCLSW